MAEQLIKGGSRRYRIDNGWLEKFKTDATKYVDVVQISIKPRESQYLIDLIEMGRTIDYDQEQMRASFWLNGFVVGDTTTNGDTVRGVYEEDDNDYIHRRPFIGAIEHPVRVRRVYSQDTKGRDIEFLGVGKKSSAGL